MPGANRLVIGLGNPGSEYEDTRHNIGFRVVEAVAEDRGVTFKREASNVLVAWASVRGQRFGLVKPQSYMNRSGRAVHNMMQRLGLRPEDLLVVFDDINLKPGMVRLRPGGSAGGHNGVQDIIDTLRTDTFPRLRVGIGSNFPRGRQVDYVLSPFTEDEKPIIREAVDTAREAVLTFVSEGIVKAMNRFNKKGG